MAHAALASDELGPGSLPIGSSFEPGQRTLETSRFDSCRGE